MQQFVKVLCVCLLAVFSIQSESASAAIPAPSPIRLPPPIEPDPVIEPLPKSTVETCVAEQLTLGRDPKYAALACIGHCPQYPLLPDLSLPLASNDDVTRLEEFGDDADNSMPAPVMNRAAAPITNPIILPPPLPISADDDTFGITHLDKTLTCIVISSSPVMFPEVQCLCGHVGGAPA